MLSDLKEWIVESGDVKSAIEEMKRVVRLGGWIVADEPDNGSVARFKPTHMLAGA